MITVLDPDGLHPKCAHPGCIRLADDGYCEAGCCLGFQLRRAFCSEHSHRPTRVLEILGYPPERDTFTRDEVRRVVMAMWAGAGLVYESAGKIEMDREIEKARARLQQQRDLQQHPTTSKE